MKLKKNCFENVKKPLSTKTSGPVGLSSHVVMLVQCLHIVSVYVNKGMCIALI